MSFASWAPNTYYLIGDIVNNGSANYQCIKVNLSSASNKPPNATYWSPYSSGGGVTALNSKTGAVSLFGDSWISVDNNVMGEPSFIQIRSPMAFNNYLPVGTPLSVAYTGVGGQSIDLLQISQLLWGFYTTATFELTIECTTFVATTVTDSVVCRVGNATGASNLSMGSTIIPLWNATLNVPFQVYFSGITQYDGISPFTLSFINPNSVPIVNTYTITLNSIAQIVLSS
jgi:hypothetical protein